LPEFPIHVGVQVVFSRNGKVLLGKRAPGRFGEGTWGLPGGHLRFREEFEECAKREALEELGVRIKKCRVFCVANTHDQKMHHVQIGLIATEWSGTPRPKSLDEVEEIRWASPKELEGEHIFYSSRPVIRNFLYNAFHAP